MERPVKTILVSCNLKLGKVMDYMPLFVFIETIALDYVQLGQGLFILSTTVETDTIKEALTLYLSPIDTLLVMALPKNQAYQLHGLEAKVEGQVAAMLND